MNKTIKIKGDIEPEMLLDIAKQIEQQDISDGDTVDVLFDSIGGLVDVSLGIAKVFRELQDGGVSMRAVAEGKVYSSAIVPFLAIDNRVAIQGCSFLVHKAAVSAIYGADKEKLIKLQQDIDDYTDVLLDFYTERGIDEGVANHLVEGEDLTLRNPDDIKKAGFVEKFVDEATRIYNKLKRVTDSAFKPSPKFGYIHNCKQLNPEQMTKNEIKNLIAEAIKDALPDIIADTAKVVNQLPLEKEEEDEILNASSVVSAEELTKLEGVLYKTSVEVEGEEDIKYLTHPSKDVEKDHFVIPTKEDGEVVKLGAGDHKVKVDGVDFVIHSTGEDWYIHSGGAENAAEEDIIPEQEEITNEAPLEDEPPKVEDAKVCNMKKSVAPTMNVVNSAPKPSNAYAKRMHDIFTPYGPGCVGK